MKVIRELIFSRTLKHLKNYLKKIDYLRQYIVYYAQKAIVLQRRKTHVFFVTFSTKNELVSNTSNVFYWKFLSLMKQISSINCKTFSIERSFWFIITRRVFFTSMSMFSKSAISTLWCIMWRLTNHTSTTMSTFWYDLNDKISS